MPNDKNKTFDGSFTTERALEAERLKKAWFDHVLNSIERLGESVDKVSFDLQTTKSAFYKDIAEAKELLRKEIALLHREVDIDVDKLEKRLNRTIDSVSKSIDSLSIKDVRDELKKEIETVKRELKKEIDIAKKEVIPLRDDVVNVRITIAKWGALGGLIVTLLLFALKWIVPIVISGLSQKP